MPTFSRAILCVLPVMNATSFMTISPAATAEDSLQPVVVTATRTARTADETLASVSVITRQDIERLQVQSLQDLLRNEVGFSVTNNGGAGKNTSVFIRGTESDHVLVLIDGIKMGSATSGTAAFQHLNIDQIDRIEIVRGSRSSLYGSEAIGGVIQIFTRKGSKTTTPNFSISAGRYNTKKVTAGVSGSGKRSWYNVGFSGYNTSGFNSCSGKPSPDGAGCFTDEPDKDSYRTQSASIRTGYRFDSNLVTDFTFTRSQGSVEFDGGFQNEADFAQQVLGGSVKYSPTDNWHTTLAIGRSKDESDNFKDGTYNSTFDTTRDSISLQNDVSFNEDHLLTLGLDYLDDKVSTSAYTPPSSSRSNKGIFAQYQGTFQANDIILAVRNDDNQTSGSHTTGSLSWGYRINPALKLVASYANAFKTPTFNELYFPFFGNENLRPESSKTGEAGIKGHSSWGRWDIMLFQTKVDNQIVYDAATLAAANINSASMRGIETRLKTQVAKWDVDANLTLLDTENKSPDGNQGNELPRRVKQSLNINMDRRYGKLNAGLSVHARGSSYDDIANTRKIKAYTTVDVRTSYQFAKDWLIQARIDNIFNKEYETASFYNQAKGDFWLTLRYQPKNP